MMQYNTVWCTDSIVWCCMVRYGMVWYSVMQLEWYGMVYGMWYGMVWYMVCGMVWCGMIYGMVRGVV